jgi:four helix bundle protein
LAATFRDLVVWKKSIDLTTLVYGFTAGFPKCEMYGLALQMRSAVVSIPSNIAEGYGRGTCSEFREAVKRAEGSNCELQTQLIIARKLRFGDSEMLLAAESLSFEIGLLLEGVSADFAREIRAGGAAPRWAG